MAVTLTSDFKLDESLVNTMFLNRLLDKTNIFNARSNGAFNVQNQFVTGFAPKVSQFDETENLISRKDIASTAAIDDKKIVQSQTGGVKLFRKVGPVAVTQTAINEQQLTQADIYRKIAEMVSGQVVKAHREEALRLVTLLISKSASKYEQTKATFKPTDVLKALEFYKEFPEMWRLTLMSITNQVAGLKQVYDDKISNFSGLAVQSGNLNSLGRPILYVEDDALDVADADASAGGAQAGSWVLFLPQTAATVQVTTQPRILTEVVLGHEQIFIRAQAEYTIVLRAKQHEWIGAQKNPTDAQVRTAASWADRAKSHVGSVGFGLQVKNAA